MDEPIEYAKYVAGRDGGHLSVTIPFEITYKEVELACADLLITKVEIDRNMILAQCTANLTVFGSTFGNISAVARRTKFLAKGKALAKGLFPELYQGESV